MNETGCKNNQEHWLKVSVQRVILQRCVVNNFVWNESHITAVDFCFSWGIFVYLFFCSCCFFFFPLFFFGGQSGGAVWWRAYTYHTVRLPHSERQQEEERQLHDSESQNLSWHPITLRSSLDQLVFKPCLYFHDRKSGSPTQSTLSLSLSHIHLVPTTPPHISSISLSGISCYWLTGQRKAG